jgi:hypothetical protein
MRSDSQLEILDPVIRAVAVAVMHFFPAGERTPEGFLHPWRSGDSGTVAPSGGTFLTGAQWESWNGGARRQPAHLDRRRRRERRHLEGDT